jgi:hypothetical protein
VVLEFGLGIHIHVALLVSITVLLRHALPAIYKRQWFAERTQSKIHPERSFDCGSRLG